MREGFWKKHEKLMKNEPENERFWERKTCQNLVRVIDFEVFRFFEKIEKSMPKWLPKSMKIDPKSDLEPTWVD